MAMHLLVVAHKGEAAAFFERSRLKRTPHSELRLYQSQLHDFALLITGEGLRAAKTQYDLALNNFKAQLSGVINFGLAGKLSDPADLTVQLHQIYSVRNVFVEQEHGEQALLSCADQDAQTDCISAQERILTEEQAKKLVARAPMVDRELWSIASLCKTAGLPLYAYKMISDLAGRDTNLERIRKHVPEYSQKLYALISKRLNI